MFIGLGIERGGFGIETAANSRYVYVGAVLLIPAFGVAVDQLARIGAPAHLGGRLLLIGGDGHEHRQHSARTAREWANRSGGERNVLELVAAVARLRDRPIRR